MVSAKVITRVSTTALLVLMTALTAAGSDLASENALDVARDVQESCPEMCQCDTKLHRVACQNGTLTEVPRNLPRTVRNLNLSGNNISVLQNDSLTHLSELRYLSLADNGLVSIEAAAFQAQVLLQGLDLHGNSLDERQLGSLEPLYTLAQLDLHDNLLSGVPRGLLSVASGLEQLDLSQNNLNGLPEGLLEELPNLLHLNLSHNRIQEFSLVPASSANETKPAGKRLELLDVSHNQVRAVGLPCFVKTSGYGRRGNVTTTALPALTQLFMGHNPNISNLLGNSFTSCPQLQWLEISHMEGLRYIDMAAFSGLTDLRHLDLSHNKQLAYLHAMTFSNLTAIITIDLAQNALTSINDATFRNLTELRTVKLAGNPWVCDCDSHWIGPLLNSSAADDKSPLSANDFVCASPPPLAGLYLVDILPSHNFSCHSAYVVNYTRTTVHTVGSSAMFDCVAAGDPSPYVAWITPRKDVIRYHPAFVHPGRPGPQSAAYHTGHTWHGTSEYAAKLPPSARRMHVLANGSLYIDYVQRHDAGPYTCLVHNHLGNDSVVVRFHLNYLIISRTMVQSMIIGFLSAAVFLAFGLITATIRYLVFTCSHEQRQKRKSIREILDGLETYRSDKMDKFSAYKTAKIDQLAAFKTAKVDKLRGYKNITVTTLVHYLHRSREHYTHQTVHIKENCAQQVEKLRESYSMQKLKFKDYRSHQIEKIKENYNGQLLKIRLYGSGQLERLRDQYKLQQQHILKLLELLDIGNCMTVLEAECMRTDSMIFNADLSFDLEAAVYAPTSRSASVSGSEYMTAGDNTDHSSNNSNSGSVNFDVKLDEVPVTAPLVKSSRTKSLSSTTLTQLKVDLAAANLKFEEEISKENNSKSSKLAKPMSAAASSTTVDTNTNTNTSSNGNQGKVRHTRRKHRHKHPPRQDTPDEEDDICSKRQRRRMSPKDRRERLKDRQKAAQVKSYDRLDASSKSDVLSRVPQSILSHAAEIDKTLEEIATDIDNLKRAPLRLSIPDLNLDLYHGVTTEPEEETTPVDPSTTTVTIENEASRHRTPPPGPSASRGDAATPHHQGIALREQWQQGKDPPSTDVQSTDYESAQEPESRGNTPQVGFYEHTGSPQSFASFPSTPSTPTLRDYNPVVILDPSQLETSVRTDSKESTV